MANEELLLAAQHLHHGSSSRISKRPSRTLRKRSSNSNEGISSSRLSNIPIVSAVIKFFDGVNLKTILICVMGMTLMMQLNPPNANHGIKNTVVMKDPATVTPRIRGAIMNESSNVAKSEWDRSLYAPPAGEAIMQPPPQQQVGAVNQGTLQKFDPQAQQVVAADPTYNQSPMQHWQQQQQAQTHQAGQSVSNVDPSQILPTQTADVVVVEIAQVAIGDAKPTTQTVEVPLIQKPAVQRSVSIELSNFKDSWDPYDKTDIPIFWHIPKAGGSSIKDAMGSCHRFVQATEFGITDGHDADTEVAIVYPAVPGVADTDRSPFVNIDSTTVAGIQRAKSMGFADAQLAGVVVSPFVFETNDLFTQTAKGRFFSVFRHPIDRAVSMFYYIRVADWEPSYKPELQEWTLEQYATSDIVENNWMTRQLSNQLGGELTDENLKKAMEVVRSKFLVGLMTQIGPSMTRFEKFFRWTYHVNPPNQEACRERLMSGGSNSNAANKKPVAEGDPAWDLLAHQNNFDLQLYTYIESLFVEQEAFVAGMPDDFRKVDGTCCKCGPPTFPPEGFTCPEAVKNA